ncbi:MAG: DUF4350 domain-containing protein [Acidobacteriota bacterium]
MRLRRPSKPIVLGLLVVVCVALLFVLAFERVEDTETRPLRGEAAVNPYYLLQETLDELGVPARSLTQLRALPPSDHTLMLAAPTRDPGARATQRLLGWARAGGHLLVVPVDDDPLLAELEIERFDETVADDDDADSRSRFAHARPTWPKLWWNPTSDDASVLRSDGPDDAAWLLTVSVGQGAVTVVSDGVFLQNEALEDEDHPLVAWHAVAFPDAPTGVWIVYRDALPSLGALLGARFELLAWSLAALTVAALLFLARRIGPLEPPATRDRRHLEEHVRAVGSYLLRVGAADSLIEPVRDAVRRSNHRAAGASSEDDRSSDHRLVERLQAEVRAGGRLESTRLTPRAVHEAFAARGEMSSPKLFRVLRTLEILRRA